LQPKGMRVSRRIVIKVCSVVSVGLVAYAALGPANWQLRPMLGWKTEHFFGFLIVTFIACVAWRRPLIVGLALMATAGLLEALQGLTPDRVPDLPTALCGAGGGASCICSSRSIHTGAKPNTARRLAFEYFERFPKERYQSELESWRHLQSQNCEFIMKRFTSRFAALGQSKEPKSFGHGLRQGPLVTRIARPVCGTKWVNRHSSFVNALRPIRRDSWN
jgi:hypothetical protein